MATTEVLQVSGYGKDAYGLSAVSKQAMINYGKALLKIVGGDGVVSPAEREWLDTHQRKFGATEDVIAAYDNFDHQSADLSELLSGMSTDVETWTAGPHLIYHAVKMSSADGVYSKGERRKVLDAARVLKVPDDIVLTIEALIRLEKAAFDIRAALFHVTIIN